MSDDFTEGVLIGIWTAVFIGALSLLVITEATHQDELQKLSLHYTTTPDGCKETRDGNIYCNTNQGKININCNYDWSEKKYYCDGSTKLTRVD